MVLPLRPAPVLGHLPLPLGHPVLKPPLGSPAFLEVLQPGGEDGAEDVGAEDTCQLAGGQGASLYPQGGIAVVGVKGNELVGWWQPYGSILG